MKIYLNKKVDIEKENILDTDSTDDTDFDFVIPLYKGIHLKLFRHRFTG
jgi:hypothetical protein